MISRYPARFLTTITGLTGATLSSVLLISAVLHSSAALASSAAHEAGVHTESVLDQIWWPTINFAIYLAIIGYFYKKKGAPALADRSESLRVQLSKSGVELEAAEREIASIRARLNNSEVERKVILQRFREEGARMGEAAIETAKSESARAELEAGKERIYALSRLEAELTASLAQKASDRARAKLQQGISAEDDRRLRDEVLGAFIGNEG